MIQIGSIVDGKYKILSEIGHGGMSVVYLAINERANKTWAIKEVRRGGTVDSAVVVNGLVAETNMLKKLNNPHLPSIIDVIELEDSFVIVMDYIEGKGLDSLLKRGGAQDPNRVIDWAKQLCDVLGYLHNRDRPIIYRDMKPANVMLKPDGTVVLLDFTTAREFKSENVEDTTCLGTRGYAAPEQFGGHGQTDARTDIYCLGATIYHLISGHSPAEPPYEIRRLGEWNPRLSGSGIERIVEKCTRLNPDERYQTCAELRYDLEHVHDMDRSAEIARRRVWRGFLACCVIAALGAAGMVGFRVAGNNAVRETYDYYVLEAGMEEDTEKAAETFRKAIELDPSDISGYEELLTYMENDLVIDSQEYLYIQNCLRNTNGRTKTNMDSLSEEDYDTIAYRLAYDIYFFYGGTGDRTAATQWFGLVLDSGTLTQQQVELANALYTIGGYYAGLDNVNPAAENVSTYRTLWDDLTALTDGDLTEKTGRQFYAVTLYKELVYQVYTNTQHFREYGVTEAEMTEQLDKAEQALLSMSVGDSTVKEIVNDVLYETIPLARTMVDAVFSGVGS